MTLIAYLVERIPWAVVGLLIGHLLSRGICDLHAVAVVVNPEETDMAEPPHRPWYRRITSNGVVGVVVFVLAVGTVVQGYVQNEQTQRIAECTKGYSNGFADAIEARAEASAAWQNALDGWMSTLDELLTRTAPDPAAARERFKLATAEYLSKRAESKKQQQQNPYPPPPRDLCK